MSPSKLFFLPILSRPTFWQIYDQYSVHHQFRAPTFQPQNFSVKLNVKFNLGTCCPIRYKLNLMLAVVNLKLSHCWDGKERLFVWFGHWFYSWKVFYTSSWYTMRLPWKFPLLFNQVPGSKGQAIWMKECTVCNCMTLYFDTVFYYGQLERSGVKRCQHATTEGHREDSHPDAWGLPPAHTTGPGNVHTHTHNFKYPPF